MEPKILAHNQNFPGHLPSGYAYGQCFILRSSCTARIMPATAILRCTVKSASFTAATRKRHSFHQKEICMNTNPVGWFEIYVADMSRAKAFYESVLALRLDKMSNSDIEMQTFPMSMDATGASGAL